MPDKFTQADMNEVSDNPEWTKEDFAKAKPFAEMLPELATAIKRTRGRPKIASPKVHVSLRVDPDVLEYYKSTGRGWQGRINDALKKSAGL